MLSYGVWFGVRVCVCAIVYMCVCALFVVDCAMLCGSCCCVLCVCFCYLGIYTHMWSCVLVGFIV